MLCAMSSASAARAATWEIDSSATEWVPEDSRSELFIALAVFFCACLYLWPLRDFVTFNADEGFTLVGAERILRGQVPYRDFFSFYTLGSFYQTAILFKLFGNSLVVAHTALIAYAGIFAAITYLLTRRVYGRSAALFSSAMIIFGCMPNRFLALHNWDSTLYALLAIYCAQRLLDCPNRIWPFVLGFTTALTLFTEESKGAGLLLGLGIAALTLSLSHCGSRFASIRNTLSAAAGFALPSLLTLGYFASKHAAAKMLEAWLWPLRHYSVVNRVPYGFSTTGNLREMYTSGPCLERIFVIIFSCPMFLISVLALLVVAATLYSIVLRCKTDSCKALDVRVLGGCIYIGVFLSTIATGRADMTHLLYLTPLFMYLVPSVLDIRHPSIQLLYIARPVAACLLLLSFGGFGAATVFRARTPAAKVETRGGTVRFASEDEIIRYVQDNVAPGQHLYIHPYQPFYSYMTGTVNPTRYDFLQPGMASADQYQSAIHDLAADQTPVVLLDTHFADKVSDIWPATPLSALASDPVTDYILQHYRTCRLLNSSPSSPWSFNYMVRKDMRCPATFHR
jgi:hypothetical protein